jgi:hypothetical protein
LICSPGTVYGGADGGLLKNGLSTFGFIWGDLNAVDELLPIGKGHAPGASLIMSSTRTEMCGLFAATVISGFAGRTRNVGHASSNWVLLTG